MYTYTYTYVYKYIYIYIYTYSYVYICIYTHIFLYTHTYIHMYLRACIHVDICTYSYLCINAQTYRQTHCQAHRPHTVICTQIHTDTNPHITTWITFIRCVHIFAHMSVYVLHVLLNVKNVWFDPLAPSSWTGGGEGFPCFIVSLPSPSVHHIICKYVMPIFATFAMFADAKL